MVACNPTLGLLRNLRFRNLDDFQVGSLHAQPAIWEKLLSNVSHEHVAANWTLVDEICYIQQPRVKLKGRQHLFVNSFLKS